MVRVKNQLQYREFLEEVYPELALKLPRTGVITAPEDIYSVYKIWCYNHGKEV